MKTFKLQITIGVTGKPFWVEIQATSATAAQSQYWASNPTHFIVWTKELQPMEAITYIPAQIIMFKGLQVDFNGSDVDRTHDAWEQDRYGFWKYRSISTSEVLYLIKNMNSVGFHGVIPMGNAKFYELRRLYSN